MKKLVLSVGLIFVAYLLQTCREDDHVEQSTVQFSFTAPTPDNAGGKISELPADAVLLLTIDDQRKTVFSRKEFSIQKIGDHYISSPVALPHGAYTVREFLIANTNHEIIFAIPMTDSPLESMVTSPLPVAFSVSGKNSIDSNLEITSTQNRQSTDFGYDPFPVPLDEPESFLLSVFIPEESTFIPTDVQAYVLHGEDTIYDESLPATTNTIAFDTDPDEFYTLVLIKDSYKKFSRTFRINDLQDELNGNALSIQLERAFTVVLDPLLLENGYNVRFDLSNDNPTLSGRLNIDWGDGSIEEIDIPHGWQEQNHVYTSGGERFVSVSGDMESVTSLSIQYDNPIRSISLKHLTELKTITIVETPTPETIDISHNTKLESASFGLTWIKSLNISNNIYLKQLFLVYMTEFSATSVNQIISDMHQHAHDYHLTEGWITLVDANGGFIGPLSTESVEKLQDLQDNYGWTIEPPLEWLE